MVTLHMQRQTEASFLAIARRFVPEPALSGSRKMFVKDVIRTVENVAWERGGVEEVELVNTLSAN